MVVKGPLKTVRIDRNTQILVSTAISDYDARDRFFACHKTKIRSEEYPRFPEKEHEGFKEIPMGSIEELPAMVEELDSMPEIE